METIRVAFLVLAFGALILAGVLTYNLLSTPEYQPVVQGQVNYQAPQQYAQQPVYNRQQAVTPQTIDSVQGYAAFQVQPAR
jgi:hypothetical protein